MKRLIANTAKVANSIVKDAEEKINPLKQKVNMTETADTGVEGIRLTYQTKKNIKKTARTIVRTVTAPSRAVKTVKRTITAPSRAIKAVKNKIKRTKRNIKTTVKVTKATVKLAVKTVQVVAKVTAKVVTEVVVALTNPVVFGIVIAVALIAYIFNGVALLLGGGDTQQTAMTMASGLGDDVESQYDKGKEYYTEALNNRKNEVNATINNLYYNGNNLKESDLIYYKRFDPTQLIYEKDYPTDYKKGNIMNEWKHQFDDSQIIDFISIAYVYLEKEANKDKETYMNIYEVEFSQDLFDEMIEVCIPFSDRVDENQECAEKNCTRDKEKYKDWQEMKEKLEHSVNGYNEWVLDIQPYIEENGYDEYWANWRVFGNWKSVFGDVFTEEPTCETAEQADEYREYCGRIYNELNTKTAELEEIYNNSTACDREHTLHSMGISFLNAEQLMTALEFDDNEKEWVELTKYGFTEMGVEE